MDLKFWHGLVGGALLATAATTAVLRGAGDPGRGAPSERGPAPTSALAATGAAPNAAPAAPASQQPSADARSPAAAAADRIRRLEREVDRLRAESNSAKGRLKELEGEYQPWTRELPAAVQPDAFRAALERMVAEAGGSVEEVDCSEYPCIAAVRWPGGLPESELMRRLNKLEADLKGTAGPGEDLSTTAKASRFANASNPAANYTLSSVSLWSSARDPGKRIDARGRPLVEGVSSLIAEEQGE
jgi:hypothetical protein